MILGYIESVLPIYLLVLLIISRFKSKIKYYCRDDGDNYDRNDCEWYLANIKISLIIGLIPILNIFLLLYWIFLFFIELPDCLVVRVLKKIATTVNDKLTEFINYVFLDKKDKKC